MTGWQGKKVQVSNAISNSPVSMVFDGLEWPQSWPYEDSNFSREDEGDDSGFYNGPRFVAHIDDGAIEAIKKFYAQHFAQAPQGDFSVLDICSSWISHYPEDLNAKPVAV